MAFELADILPALPEIILSAVALVLVLAAYGGDARQMRGGGTFDASQLFWRRWPCFP